MEKPVAKEASSGVNYQFFKALIGFFILLWSVLILFFLGDDFFCFSSIMFVVSWVIILQSIISVSVKPDNPDKSAMQDSDQKRQLSLSESIVQGIIAVVLLAIAAFILLPTYFLSDLFG